jgi:hypothetical protein
MSLTDQYKRAGRRTVNHGRPPAERRLRQARVMKFLDWCDIKGVQTFAGIRQEHYASFIRRLHNDGVAERTVYRYRLALREFVRRWSIRVTVAAPQQKRAGSWLEDIRGILERIEEMDPVLRARIMEALKKGKAR